MPDIVITAREGLSNHIAATQMTQQQIARDLMLSPTLLSLFLSGTYQGNNEEVAEKIMKYLNGNSQAQSIEAPKFCAELRNAKQVLFAASYAHHNHDIAIVYGGAGAGKTTALRHYRENNTGVIFVTANASSRTAKAAFNLIFQAIGKRQTGSEFQMMQTLVAFFKDRNALIIFDEADHLNVRALQAIRNLNDEAGVGILFSGNDIIKLQMYGRGSMQYDQLRTRVGVSKKVENNYTMDEMKALFPDLSADCVKHLRKIACNESLRTAVKRYCFAAQCAARSGEAFSLSHLKVVDELMSEE